MFWFTSDHHFSHTNIIDFADRPFLDIEDMNEVLVANWNAVVAPSDVVWVLGDICMGRLETSLEIIGRLNGGIILVAGNHDRCWIGGASGVKLAAARKRYLDAGIAAIADTGAGHEEPRIQLSNGVVVKLSHFPHAGDSHELGSEDRFSAYRPEDDGGWLLHGHVHTSWKRRDREINVGVDRWDYTPVSEAQIVELMTA